MVLHGRILQRPTSPDIPNPPVSSRGCYHGNHRKIFGESHCLTRPSYQDTPLHGRDRGTLARHELLKESQKINFPGKLQKNGFQDGMGHEISGCNEEALLLLCRLTTTIQPLVHVMTDNR